MTQNPNFIPNSADANAGQAQQARPDSADFTILANGYNDVGIESGCAVTAQGTPNMTVQVASGTVHIASRGSITVAAVSSLSIAAADANNPRTDLVTVNTSGTVSVTTGTAAGTPVFPVIPANSVVLAAVFVSAGATSITNANIIDKRLFVPPYDLAQHQWGPNEQGYAAWTFDPVFGGTGAAQPSSGQIKLYRVRSQITTSVSHIDVVVQTAGSGLTSGQNLLGVYDDSGNRLGVSGDMTTAFGSTGVATGTMTAFNVTAGQILRLAILMVGTTIPHIAELGEPATIAMTNINLSTANARGIFFTGQTSMPTTLTYSSASVGSAFMWMGLRA
jgi:hypothetical protein